jgi:hypothetical protein
MPDSQLSIRGHYQAAVPRRDVLRLEQEVDAIEESGSARDAQANEKQAAVRSRRILADVRKVEILRNEKPTSRLNGCPHNIVRLPNEAFRITVSTSCPSQASAQTSRFGRFSSSLIFTV